MEKDHWYETPRGGQRAEEEADERPPGAGEEGQGCPRARVSSAGERSNPTMLTTLNLLKDTGPCTSGR